MNHLFAPLVSRSESNPDDLFALIVRGGAEVRLTNREVIGRASVFGKAARESGCVVGDIVLLVLDHSEYLYPAFIGCVLAGFIPSFMAPLTRQQDPNVYQKSMRALFARIKPRAIITSAKASQAIPQTDAELIVADTISYSDKVALSEQKSQSALISSSEIAFLQHS